MATANQSWDMRGRTAMVTGATGGIGFETARILARGGARVIITGRDADRGKSAAALLRRDGGTASVTFLQADHATVGGNQRLGAQVRAACTGLDVLINNVGALNDRRKTTADGYEHTLAMNFVGPFALTAALLPLLRANAPSRCVNVISAAFTMYKRDPFTDVQAKESFVGSDVYAHTKLLNLLFGLALAKRLAGEQISVNMIHPGITWTQMTRSQTRQTMPSVRWIWPIIRLIQRHGSPAKAARRVAFLACSPEATVYTGAYFERSHNPKRLSARELNGEYQERAWQLGSQLVAAAPTRLIVPGRDAANHSPSQS